MKEKFHYPSVYRRLIFLLSKLTEADNSRIPLVTLTLAALMVIVTNVWFVAGLCVPFSSSCHPDWMTLPGFATLMVWSIVSPFIHLNFPHLAFDLAGFVFLGSLVEVWVTRVPVKARYMILMVGYGATVFVNLLEVFRAGAGASIWDYSLLAVPLYYWFKFHKETRWFLSYPILGGLVLLFIPFGETVYFRLVLLTYEHFAGLVWGTLASILILDKTGLRREN